MPGVVTAGRLVDDRYRLLEALEEGGMGILWRAEDLVSERYVTVKELRFPDPLDHMQRRALAARVRREARAMAAVSHPGLARIVDVVDDGDRPWVVTELVEDPTLAALVAAEGPMEPERAALLGIRLLEVLDAATDQEMVHRFLQPSKVFVSSSNEVRVADFGIASLIGDPTVASTGAVGGVSFMAPEQAGTAEADIWSLGAVLYYAVEGVPPFDGDDLSAILLAVAGEPPRPATRVGSLARVLEVTLQKDPSERPSADELRSLLEVAAGPLAPRPEPESPQDDTIIWADPDPEPEPELLLEDPAPGGPELDDAPAPVEQEPPPPLPPRVALERMWLPDPGAPPAVFAPVDEHREPPPPWPVVHKRGLLTTVLVGLVTAIMLVILVTNGREIFSSRTHAARTIAAIKWVQYSDPATGFRIDYPADWRVTREGVYTNFTHPKYAAALRIVAQPSSARSSEAGWIDLEKQFAQNQSSYRRIRLEPKAYRGFDAAEWEFAYNRSGVALHNIDLGVVTGQQAYSLNFETQEANWTAVRPLFQRFESSFHPPAL